VAGNRRQSDGKRCRRGARRPTPIAMAGSHPLLPAKVNPAAFRPRA
jgi:hypothetical protein